MSNPIIKKIWVGNNRTLLRKDGIRRSTVNQVGMSLEIFKS